MKRGRLYFGDNLDVLRSGDFREGTIDLIYLDPPFNSNRDYNVLFQERDLSASKAQIKAFEDSWHWDQEAQSTFEELTGPEAVRHGATPALSVLLDALFRALPKRNDLLAYLVMMAPRLIELRRVLSPNGSLYLHCDPTASHYLKLMLDAIFGAQNFANELVWQRTNSRSATERWPRLHDSLLFYSKGERRTFNPVQVLGESAKLPHTLVIGPDGQKYQTYELTAPNLRFGETGKPWRGFEPSKMGRCWSNPPSVMEEWDAQGLIHWPKKKGGWPRRRAAEPFRAEDRMVTVGDVWTDVDRINQSAKERVGYPTQKPLALLERIISASSNPGDVVLDPFCGCGTTIEAAQTLGREWIGIDITHLAIRVVRDRLASKFPGVEYELLGEPQDIESARVLAETSPYQFQWWAVHRVGAQPFGGDPGSRAGSRGRDRGVDGFVKFKSGSTVHEAIISVKGGRTITPAMVRELRGTIERDKAALGVLISMQEPSAEMRREAIGAGFFKAQGRKYPRLQLLSVADIFAGKRIQRPGEDETPSKEAAVGENLFLPGLGGLPSPPRRGVRIKVPATPAGDPIPLSREANAASEQRESTPPRSGKRKAK